jgi:hypothetical protein
MKLLPSVSLLTAVAVTFVNVSCTEPSPKATRIETEAQAVAELGRQKDLAEQWAAKMRRDQATISKEVLKKAEEKYRSAAATNKGYLNAVGQGVVEKRDLSKSSVYKQLATKAETATNDFVDFAKANTGAPQALKSVGASVVVGILIDAGITIWKAYAAQARAEREANADRIVKNATWTDWDKL